MALVAAGCHEEGDVRVTGIRFDGVRHVDPDRLKSIIATKEGSRLPWGRKAFFDRKRFDVDLQRIRAYYVDHGFPDARVTDVDVDLNDAQDAVALTVRIDEGRPVVVDSVDYQGFEGLDRRARHRLERAGAPTPGEPFDRPRVAAAREAAVRILKDRGYPYAGVEARAEPVGGDEYRVAITYEAARGTLARIGEISVAGNTSVDDNLIRRQLAFHTGDEYRQSAILESQRRLYHLELFQFANVEPVTGGGQPASVPMRVTVAEAKHRRVDFGVGYGSEEKARVDARWQHANFFGGARTFGVNARWSSLDRGVKTDFTQPYFLSPSLSLGVSGQAWNTVEPNYSILSTGGRVTLNHRSGPHDSWSVGLFDEYQRSSVSEAALEDLTLRDELIAIGLDPRDGVQAGTAIGFEFDVQRNTAGRLVNARRGYYAALHVEQAGGWLPGSFDYYTATLDTRKYQRLFGGVVLAVRAQAGVLDSIGRARPNLPEGVDTSENIPFSKRFFLGGSTSLRGWGRYDVSPLSESGLPIGGRSMLELTSEVRIPVKGRLSAVLFADAGNVWADSWDMRLSDLRYDAGPGLRYLTPIGPVRVDVGYQLNPIDGLLVNGEPERRHWRVHFSIGQAF